MSLASPWNLRPSLHSDASDARQTEIAERDSATRLTAKRGTNVEQRSGISIWTNHMKLPRRQFLHLAAGAAALPAVSRIARAQAYPSRPVRLIVACSALAAGSDIAARLIGQLLVGAARPAFRHREPAGRRRQYRHEAVVRAPPDGYTLLLVSCRQRDQRDALRQAQFQFHPRYRARRERSSVCLT